MAVSTKNPVPVPVPLQAVVGVMCDALADLQPADQARALEAARITLGVSKRPAIEMVMPSDPASVDVRMALIAEFGRSLRAEQVQRLMEILDMTQKILVMEILGSVNPPEQGG